MTTLPFYQALFCASISLFSLVISIYVCSRILNKDMGYKNVIPFFTVNLFMMINFSCEAFSFISAAFTTKYLEFFANLYMLSMYGFLASFLWFCVCLNGKRNFGWLLISICIFMILIYAHINGLLISGFKYNGLVLVREPGKYYSLFELIAILLGTSYFVILYRFAKGLNAEIRSRAIITLFAAVPVLFILMLTMVLMRFIDNYSTALFTPIFFTWMNIVLLFATGRAVVDLSFSRQHIKAYSLLFKSASTKNASVVERMKMVEEAWYMITGASSYGDIDVMAEKLNDTPENLYKKVGQRPRI